jgi:hypothetical protein
MPQSFAALTNQPEVSRNQDRANKARAAREFRGQTKTPRQTGALNVTSKFPNGEGARYDPIISLYDPFGLISA